MFRVVLGWICLLAVVTEGMAAEVVNVYSARHYDTDDRIYSAFEEQTGIKVRLIEGKSDALLARLKREGKRSPADVFITVDAGRLFQAERQRVFQPISSKRLTTRVPANLRHPKGLWFGLTKRARIILRSKERVKEGEITSYEDLAKPKWKGRVLIRSSSNVYNQSLVGSMIVAHGVKGAEAWCRGLVANMARKPQGGIVIRSRAWLPERLMSRSRTRTTTPGCSVGHRRKRLRRRRWPWCSPTRTVGART